MYRTSISPVRNRFPFRRTVSSSPSRVNRLVRGNGRRLDAGVLGRELYRQPLAPLFPATAQHLTPPLRFHTRAKPMRLESTGVPRAVSWLPHCYSKMLVKIIFPERRKPSPLHHIDQVPLLLVCYREC